MFLGILGSLAVVLCVAWADDSGGDIKVSCTFHEAFKFIYNCYRDVKLDDIYDEVTGEQLLNIAITFCKGFSSGSRCASAHTENCENQDDIFNMWLGKLNICKATNLWIRPYLLNKLTKVLVSKACLESVFNVDSYCPTQNYYPSFDGNIYTISYYLYNQSRVLMECALSDGFVADMSTKQECVGFEPRDAILTYIVTMSNNWYLDSEVFDPRIIQRVLAMESVNSSPTGINMSL